MTIAILKLEAGQKIARPFNRACNTAEAAEMLAGWQAAQQKQTPSERQKFTEFARTCPAPFYTAANLDSEKPVFTYEGTKFYAFTEE